MSRRRPLWGEGFERTDGGSPSEPTLLGGGWSGEHSARAGEAPTWPPAGTASGEHGAGSRSPSSMRVTILAFALGGMALLVGLFSLLTQTGLISLGAGPTGSTSDPRTGAGGTPTATPSLTPPSAGWLQVAPASITLGCDDATRVQVVVLANQGSESVQWKVTLPQPSDQAGVEVSPTRGRLAAGASLALRVQNRTHHAERRGALRFDPQQTAAGPPASLSYTAEGCG